MRAPHWIAVTIVALCAGLGAGYLLFHNEPPPRIAADPQYQEPADTRPDGNSENESEFFVSTGVDIRPGFEASQDADKPGTNDDRLVAALRTFGFEFPPKAEGKILGTVTDPFGRPVAGVELVLVPRMDQKRADLAKFDDANDPQLWTYLAKQTRAEVACIAGPLILRRTATTDAAGYYEFSGIWDLSFDLTAKYEGYQLSAEPSPEGVKPGARIDWVAWRYAKIQVAAYLPYAVEEPSLFVCYESGKGVPTKVGLQPGVPRTLTIPEGTYRIWGEEVALQLTCKAQEVSVERGAEQPLIELRPTEQPRLIVELDCPGGKPLTALEVRYAPLQFGVSNATHFDGNNGAGALTERNGKAGMTSEPLAVGPYVVGVFVAGKLVASARADVTDPPTSQRATLPGPNEADGIVCTVVLPAQHRDKQPSFSIAWGGSAEEFESPVKFEEVWDLGEQRYFLQVGQQMRGNVAPTLWISVPGLGLVRKRIARASGAVTVEFLPAGRLRVEVLNVPEAIRRRILLEVNSSDLARPSNAGHVGYDADAGVSVQQWESIQPGMITLSIYIEREGPVLATTTLDLPAGGDERVSIKLPSLFELSVNRIDRSIDGASLYEGARDGRLIRRLTFDKGDTVVVSYLPTGTYTIRYRVNREDRERKVAVDGDTTVHLRN